MEMQGLKPSVLMGKLEQHLPPGVSPDNDLFLAIFLIRLLPSMREAVGVGTHTTAAAMVKAADALWDAQGGHDLTVAAASIQRSRSPAPHNGKRGKKKSGNTHSKSRSPSRPEFYSFQNPGNASVNFTTTTPTRLALCLVGKLTSRQTPFGLAAIPTATATAMHFPANAGLIFLTDELSNDRYLVDTGATLSLVPCNQNSSPSGPPSQRGRWATNLLFGLHSKNGAKPLWPVPFWALTF
jgi:hypothetical protein